MDWIGPVMLSEPKLHCGMIKFVVAWNTLSNLRVSHWSADTDVRSFFFLKI